MKETYAVVLKSRTELEIMSIEGSSTAQAVSFITFVQDLSRKVAVWGPDIEQFALGEKTLERQRYSFPGDWLYIDQVQSEWSAFSDILKRKDDSIKDQVGELKVEDSMIRNANSVAGLQLKIVAEDKIVDGRIAEFISEWESNKYVSECPRLMTGHCKAVSVPMSPSTH
jgi:dynein heavy chain 1